MTLVTGTVYTPDGEVARRVKITIGRDPEFVVAQNGGTVVPSAIYVRADGNGDVSFDILPGSYVAVFQETGNQRWTATLSVPEEETADLGDLVNVAQIPIAPDLVLQAQEARDDAETAAAAADASADLAQLYAPAYYASPAAFFAAATVWPNGTRINARTGEVWDVVAAGTGDFNHPVSGIGLEVVPSPALSVLAFGAKGDGVTDDSVAFERAVLAAIRLAHTPSIGSNPIIGPKISVPSTGDLYRVAQPRKLLPNTGSTRYVGLTFEGEGLVEINFDYDGDDYMCYNNNQHLIVTFRNLFFTCNSDTSKFIYSTGNGGAQDYTFDNCHWNGVWQKLFVLRGANNNSEWKWIGCGITLSIRDVMLDLADSDQFLNYWFWGCKIWLYDGQCIRSSAGGHFKFVTCDWSGLQGNRTLCTSTKGKYLFEFTGQSHAYGVCDFRVIGGRFECKTNADLNGINARLVYCEWNQGNIEFSADCSSTILDAYDSEYSFQLERGNTPGPLVKIRDSYLVGKIKATSSGSGHPHRSIVDVENTTFGSNNLSAPADFIEVNQPAPNYGAMWPVRLRGCRPGLNNSYYDATEKLTAWDVIIGGRYSISLPNEMSVAQFVGNPNGGGNPINNEKCYLQLPPNSEIVHVAIENNGLGGSGTAATWRIYDEGAAATIYTGTAGRALNAKWRDESRVMHVTTSGLISLYDSAAATVTSSAGGFRAIVTFISL